MTAKKSEPKYTTYGEELSTEVAYLQSASILDIAAFMAIEERKLERLETLAVLWMELGEKLMRGPEGACDGDGDEEEFVMGFRNGGNDNERVTG